MASAESEVASFLLAPILFGRPGLPSLKFQAQFVFRSRLCVLLYFNEICFLSLFLLFFCIIWFLCPLAYQASINYLGKIKIWLINGLVNLKPQGLVKFVTTKICEALYGKIEMPIPLLSILKVLNVYFLASKENIHSGMRCVDRKFKSCHQL